MIRDNEIYIETITRRGLFYVPRQEGTTLDQLANEIIADWLKANHPLVVEHLKSQAEQDRQFREHYKQRSKPEPREAL